MPRAKKNTTKSTAPAETEIVVLLDRSGSMQSVKQDMEGGFASFLADQRKIKTPCRMSLTQFDDGGVDTVYEGTPLADAPTLELTPRGNTPLFDAIGKTIKRTRDRVASLGRTVLFLIITDGQENASREYKKGDIKKLIEERTAAGWVFSYLGANVDAFAEAGALGIALSNTANYVTDTVGVKYAFAAASCSTSNLRARGASAYSLTNNDSRVTSTPGAANPAAAYLGGLGGKKGGVARAKALDADTRSDIARKAALARWSK